MTKQGVEFLHSRPHMSHMSRKLGAPACKTDGLWVQFPLGEDGFCWFPFDFHFALAKLENGRKQGCRERDKA